MTLKRLPDGRWRLRYYADGVKLGRRVQETLDADTTEAEAKAKYRRRLADASARVGKPIAPRKLSFAEAVKEYLAYAESRVAKGTLVNLKVTFDGHMIPFFVGRRMDTIRPSDVERYQEKRTEDGAAPGTVNLEVSRLRSLVTRLRAWGWLEADPFPSGTLNPLPKSHGRTEFFSPEEWRAFRTSIEDDEKWSGYARKLGKMDTGAYRERIRAAVPVLRALLYVGGRLTEVTGLTWRDVDLAAGRIVIPQPKLRAKTKTLMVSRALRQLLEAQPRGLAGAPVFRHPDGRAWRDAEIQKAFVVLRRLSGTRRELSVHSTRHTFASWLTMAGVPLRTVSELLGHSSIEMTARYAHLSPGHLAGAVELIETVENEGTAPLKRHLEAALLPFTKIEAAAFSEDRGAKSG